MSFNWSEYLDIARELAGQATVLSSTEAKKRCAISRAYYGSVLQPSSTLLQACGPREPHPRQVDILLDKGSPVTCKNTMVDPIYPTPSFVWMGSSTSSRLVPVFCDYRFMRQACASR